MQAIGPILEEAPFARARPSGRNLRALLLWSAALALGAGLEARLAASPPGAPGLFFARTAQNAASPAARPANPYGALVDRAVFAARAPVSPGERSLGLALAVRPYGALVDPTFRDADLAASQSADRTRFAAALAIAAAGPARAAARPYGTLAAFFGDATSTPPLLEPPLRTSLDLAQPVAEPPEAPIPPRREVASVDDAPLPPTRPSELAGLAPPERRAPTRAAGAAPAPTPAPGDNRTLFERLFGIGASPDNAVAYAAPESPGPFGRGAPVASDATAGVSLFSRSAPPAGYDQYTAVYDISARTVYMPDGTRLEAHSGLGERLDDPRFVSERMRGATPPHLYALEPREETFHGVAALRLTPIGDGPLYGRAGLLAHPFMLGPNGDSNGCVSFKDYDAFLRAFRDGQVKRLAVVAKL
jgi:hypothetical protein